MTYSRRTGSDGDCRAGARLSVGMDRGGVRPSEFRAIGSLIRETLAALGAKSSRAMGETVVGLGNRG